MKSLKKQRRIQIIAIAMVAMALSTTLMVFAFRDGVAFFRSPSDIAEAPPEANEYFRMGGLVVEGSIQPDEGVRFFFDVTDGGETVPVHYVGNELRPDLFSEGTGVVVEGYYVAPVFEATKIMAKHDESYMPAEVVDILKEEGVYRHSEDGDATDASAITN